MLKVIGIVLGILIAYVILTKPGTAAVFIAGLITALEAFFLVLINALLTLAKAVISIFQTAEHV